VSRRRAPAIKDQTVTAEILHGPFLLSLTQVKLEAKLCLAVAGLFLSGSWIEASPIKPANWPDNRASPSMLTWRHVVPRGAYPPVTSASTGEADPAVPVPRFEAETSVACAD